MRSIPPLIALFLAGGCAGVLANRLTLPDQNTLVRDQLVIHGDFPLALHHRLFEDLTAQRADLCRRLALPCSDEPIHVYLFESSERFDGFIRLYHPEFPARRAFFLETDAKLAVYAQWGDHMSEDLRHEVAHGYLHSIVPEIPMWLDEGIAEFYEVSRSQQGQNRPHIERLLERMENERWRPDLRRLERLPPEQSLSQDDYGEAWGWVHFLLESRPEYLEVLRAYLSDLRRSGVSVSISTRLSNLSENYEEAWVDHIRRMEKNP